MTNQYQAFGYTDRDDYLSCLAEAYGVPEAIVYELAALLGPDEDFDGLVIAVEEAVQ